MMTEDLYTVGENVTRLPPVPEAPAEVQEKLMAKAEWKRWIKKLKRLGTWEGKGKCRIITLRNMSSYTGRK